MATIDHDLHILELKRLQTYQLAIKLAKDAEARIEVEKKKKYDEIKHLKA